MPDSPFQAAPGADQPNGGPQQPPADQGQGQIAPYAQAPIPQQKKSWYRQNAELLNDIGEVEAMVGELQKVALDLQYSVSQDKVKLVNKAIQMLVMSSRGLIGAQELLSNLTKISEGLDTPFREWTVSQTKIGETNRYEVKEIGGCGVPSIIVHDTKSDKWEGVGGSPEVNDRNINLVKYWLYTGKPSITMEQEPSVSLDGQIGYEPTKHGTTAALRVWPDIVGEEHNKRLKTGSQLSVARRVGIQSTVGNWSTGVQRDVKVKTGIQYGVSRPTGVQKQIAFKYTPGISNPRSGSIKGNILRGKSLWKTLPAGTLPILKGPKGGKFPKNGAVYNTDIKKRIERLFLLSKGSINSLSSGSYGKAVSLNSDVSEDRGPRKSVESFMFSSGNRVSHTPSGKVGVITRLIGGEKGTQNRYLVNTGSGSSFVSREADLKVPPTR